MIACPFCGGTMIDEGYDAHCDTCNYTTNEEYQCNSCSFYAWCTTTHLTTPPDDECLFRKVSNELQATLKENKALEKKLKISQKNNRNWRRKCQRLRSGSKNE